jgi:peptide/nickel transport system substrate-binding protein
MQLKGLSLTLAALAGAALILGTPARAAHPAGPPPSDDDEVVGPGKAPLDPFHPDRDTPVTPLYGGRVIVHLASLPESICYPVENSAVTRRLLYEVHETLLLQDWEFHDYVPSAAASYVMEDLVVLKDDARDQYAGTAGVIDARVLRSDTLEEGQPRHKKVRAVYGTVTEGPGVYSVTPASKGSALPGTLTIPAGHVESVQRGSVFTFSLREGVRWHPSLVFAKDVSAKLANQTLDARDVLFSLGIYQNKAVDCDEKRFMFEKVTATEAVDDLTVRAFYEVQYAFALDALGTSLTVLPSHVYDLSDPDNPDYSERVTPEEQGKHINENPHNQLWVGLGPYRVTQWTQQYVQAERFTDSAGKSAFFDPARAGYVDMIRWRYIDDDEAAMNALLNGELDFFERIKPVDYFEGRAESDLFKKSFYKGYKYLGIYGYTGWNMYRPQLSELEVRKALAHAFDFEEYRLTNYKGLARQVTGPFPFNSAAYDHSVEPLAYDPELAEEMLDDAGWYDRDGDGVRDKNGVALELDFLMPSGNDASRNFGRKLQESLGKLNVKLNIVQLEWATFLEKMKSRQFDCCNLAWVPELESDPEQLWHSKYGVPESRGSNTSGVMDPHIDELIAKGQRELDKAKRQEIWHAMHRYIYNEVQPYMFMYNVPQKYGMSKRVRGFQAVAIDPGYVIRRWFYFDPKEPGTRRTLDR